MSPRGAALVPRDVDPTALDGLGADVGTAAERVAAVVVRTPADYAAAGELLTAVVKPLRKRIADFFRPMREAAHRAHRAVVERERALDDPLRDAEAELKGRMARWRDAEERRRQEREAALRAKHPAAPPTVASRVPDVPGVAERTGWAWEVEDAARLPREYLVPDREKIGRVVRALGADAAGTVPGIRVWPETTIAARGRA